MPNDDEEYEDYQIRSDLGQYNSSNGNDSAEAISTKKPNIISNFKQAISENIAKIKEEKAKRDAEVAELKLLEEEAKTQAKAEKAQIKEEQDYENRELKKAETYNTAYDKELRRKELKDKLALAAGKVTESASKLVSGITKNNPPSMATGQPAIKQPAIQKQARQPMFGTPNFSGFSTSNSQPNYSGFGTMGNIGVPLIGSPMRQTGRRVKQQAYASSMPPLFSSGAQTGRKKIPQRKGGVSSFRSSALPPLFKNMKAQNYGAMGSLGKMNIGKGMGKMPSLFGKPSKKKKGWQF